MATTPKQPEPESLTFELDGPKVTADKFLRGIGLFLGLINAVAETFSDSTGSVRWIVSVSSGSQRIHFKAESANQSLPLHQLPVLLRNIQGGLEIIEKTSERPPYFDDKALKYARNLASILGNGEELESILVSINGHKNPITTKTLAHVDSLFRTVKIDWGSVEGTVKVISKKRGDPQVQIYDDVLERYVKCRVKDDMLRQMLEAFDRRVNVFGLVRYDPAGNIKHIEVERCKIFPEEEALPTFAEVCGIFRGAE